MTAPGLALLLLLAGSPEGGPRPPPGKGRVAMEMLDAEALGACAQAGGTVALVRVVAVELVAAGTRSEHVTVELQVERALCGSPPPTLEAWTFTSAGDRRVQPGRRYLAGLVPAMGYAPWGLTGQVEVPPGREAEAIANHEKALAALGAGKPKP